MNTSIRRTTHATERPIQPPPDFSQLASIVSRHFKLKQRAAVGGLLTLVIILSIIAGAVGLVTIQLQSTSFAGLEASGTALKAQQLAKIKAVQADVTAYANADTLAEARQFIIPTGLYRETTVAPEAINPDGSKEKAVSIKVYKTNASTAPLFELDTIIYNKADVQGIPTGTIVLWSGSKIPDGWTLCDGTKGTPNLKDKFIVGAGASYTLGTVGGEAYHTLTIEEMPSHTHSMLHYACWDSAGGGFIPGYRNYQGGGILFNTNPTGSNKPHENRPPYYALYYIMKS